MADARIAQTNVTQHQAALSLTASQVSDFDTEVSNNTSVAANTAKVSNATHTGEVTGSTALTIANRTGLDAGVVTGTAGTADNAAKWNADGDLVDSAMIEARVINSMGTGLVEGGVLSINADTTKFDVSAGHGVVIDETDPDAPIVYNVSWNAFTAQTVTNLATDPATYVSINSAGAIVQSTSAPVASDGQLLIFLGQLGHANNTNIANAVITPTIFNNGTNLIRAISETLGVLGTGNEISANGANLSIDKAVGTLVKEGINFEAGTTARHTKQMPAQILATIRRRTQTGGSGTATTIDPANYDVAGTVTAVPTNKYTNQRVYLVSSGNIVVQYGQNVHNSLDEAVSAINSESFVLLANLEENAKLIGVISVKNNATDLTNTAQAKFSKIESIAAPSGTGVTDHGGLTGLADDDHTQYSLITSQAGAPTSTPTRVGEVNVDLTNDDVYISADTTGSGDWKLATGGGGGDVSKVGTPAAGQIGVWTGDGTIEGTANLTWNGSTLYTSGTLSAGGAIQVGGLVDGRDVAADGSKLDLLDAVITPTDNANAVNDVGVANAATGNAPAISAVGTDTNIDLDINAKGTGNISLGNFVFNADQSISAANDNHVLTYDNATGEIGLEAAAGGGGDVATDTLWDAAGDLAIGTGADAAARLAIGTNGQVLTSNGTTATWAAPTGGATETAETSIWIDAGAMLPDATAEASSKTGTNGNVDVFLMANTEKVYAKWTPPPQWDGGTIDVDVYWTATGATAGHKVKWNLAAQAGGNDDAWDVAFPTPTATADDDVIASGDIHVISASSITVGGTPADGDCVFFEIERTASGATQMSQEAELLGIRVKYQNSLMQNWYSWKLGNETSDATTGIKSTWYAPAAGKIYSARGGATTATSGGATTVDVHKGGTTIFSTYKLIFETGESSIETTTNKPTLTTDPTTFAAGDKFEFEVDSTTAGAAGLHVDLLISWD
jgi:hypothetical protein